MSQAELIQIGISIAFMAALGLTLSVALVIANRRLWVHEDPRIDEVEEMLPSTNCGACGTAGCRVFAEELIAGNMEPAGCTVNSSEAIGEIAEFLGVDAGTAVKRVARLACAGGSHVARMRSHYQGLDSCRAASVVAGGPKGCSWGCLGLADCADVCDQDAITMDRHGLPVVDGEKCTACNDCVEICPKGLFSLQSVEHHLWVACKNPQKDELAEAECEVACTACERCAKDAAYGLIEMRDNLPVIDYSRNVLASKEAIQRCPTGAIVWMDQDGRIERGRDAKHIVRDEALPLG